MRTKAEYKEAYHCLVEQLIKLTLEQKGSLSKKDCQKAAKAVKQHYGIAAPVWLNKTIKDQKIDTGLIINRKSLAAQYVVIEVHWYYQKVKEGLYELNFNPDGTWHLSRAAENERHWMEDVEDELSMA
jgi:hypothetical protein